MLTLFFYILLSNIVVYTIGYLIIAKKKFPFFINKNDFSELSILGFSTICLLGFLINFFIPLNRFFNSTIFIILMVLFLFFSFKEKKIIEYKNIILSSLIAFLIICANEIYRPDAGLYHLPFISILNESKIIIGLSNLHFRYGHVSIIQYGSAFFNNIFFENEGILILPSLIFSYFFIFYSKFILKILNKGIKKQFFYPKNIEIFFYINSFFIYFLYKMNNYNNFGNDVPAHLFAFYSVILFLQLKKSTNAANFSKFLFFSTITFFLKNTLILIFILIIFLPINFLLKQFNWKNIMIMTIVFSWLLKNLLISGCAIYPVKLTCYNFSWTDIKEVEDVNIKSEAWSKAWPDQIKKIDHKNYIKDFNWVKTWYKNNLFLIFEILIPYLILLLILLITLTQRKKRSSLEFSNFSQKILLFSIISTAIWFYKFPIYRYGSSFIIILITSIFYFLLNKNNLNLNLPIIKKRLTIFYSLIFIILATKNINRIYSNIDTKWHKYPWPKIYSETLENTVLENLAVKQNDNTILYYRPNQRMCMYSKSPCTNYSPNIKIDKILGYKIYKKIN